MGRPLPPSSSSLFISPVPSQQPPVDFPTFVCYLFAIYFIVSLIYVLRHIIRRWLFLDSRQVQVHDPDHPTPTDRDTTITAASALELLKSDHLIIYIDDSPSSSSSSSSSLPDAEARPSDKLVISCPICWEEAAEGEAVRALPRCRHAYHQACIDLWLLMGSQSCPLCRDRLTVRLVERL